MWSDLVRSLATVQFLTLKTRVGFRHLRNPVAEVALPLDCSLGQGIFCREMVASTAVNRASTSLFHLRSLVLLSEPEMEAAVNRAML